MSKNKKNAQPFEEATAEKRVPTASYRTMPVKGPVPVRPASANVQLTPIVQPIAFVPYSSQEQPLYTWDDENEVAYDAQEPQEEIVYKAAKVKKAINVVSIILIVLSLIMALSIVLGKFVDTSILTAVTQGEDSISGELADEAASAAIAEGETSTSLFGLVEGFIKGLDFSEFSLSSLTEGTNLVAIMVLLSGAFAVLVLLFSLFRLKKKGTSLLTKIFAALCAVAGIAALIVAFISKDFDQGIGLYIVTAISVLIALFAIIARGQKKIR